MFIFQLDHFLSSEIWEFDGIIAVGLAVFKAKNRFCVFIFLFLLLREALKEERRLKILKPGPHIENIKVSCIFKGFLGLCGSSWDPASFDGADTTVKTLNKWDLDWKHSTYFV